MLRGFVQVVWGVGRRGRMRSGGWRGMWSVECDNGRGVCGVNGVSRTRRVAGWLGGIGIGVLRMRLGCIENVLAFMFPSFFHCSAII